LYCPLLLLSAVYRDFLIKPCGSNGDIDEFPGVFAGQQIYAALWYNTEKD